MKRGLAFVVVAGVLLAPLSVLGQATSGINSGQIKDGAVQRRNVNTTKSGQAVITKVVAGPGISLSSTGADSGTGDVTVSATGATGVSSVNGRTGAVTLFGSDVPLFGASGSGHAAGSVPDPGAAAGSTHFLREDGTWAVPPGSGSGTGTSDHKTSLNSSDDAGGGADYLDAKLGVSGILTIGDVSGVRVIGLGAAGAGVSGYLLATDWSSFRAKEPGLGNPSADGYVLSSTAAGVRSWTQPQSGPAGATGPQGAPGTAATVSVGTVTTLSPGAAATVTNSGTASAAVLNFGIPQGTQGVPGPQGPQGTSGTGTGGSAFTPVSSLPPPTAAVQGQGYLLKGNGAMPDALYAGVQVVGTSKYAYAALSAASYLYYFKPPSGTALKTSGSSLLAGLVSCVPLYEGSGTTVQDLATGSTAAIPSGWSWGQTQAEGVVLTNTGANQGPTFSGITPITGDITVLVIAIPNAGDSYGNGTYWGEQSAGAWTTSLDLRGWSADGSGASPTWTTPPGTNYYVATRSAASGVETVYNIAGQAVATLVTETDSPGAGPATSTQRVIGGGVESRFLAGSMVFAAAWNRVLTSAEITQLSTDPYSMFQGH